MNLDRALEQAHATEGAGKAAKLYNNIEYELALGDYTEDQAQGAEGALAVLEERFPGVRQAAHEIDTPPALSRGAGDNLRSGNGHKPPVQARTRAQHRAERRVPSRSLGQRVSHATAIHARPRRRARGGGGLVSGRGRRGAGGIGRGVVRAVEGIVGLTLLGLLVSDRGSQAISAGGGLLGTLLGHIASPTADPLAFGARFQPSAGTSIAMLPPGAYTASGAVKTGGALAAAKAPYKGLPFPPTHLLNAPSEKPLVTWLQTHGWTNPQIGNYLRSTTLPVPVGFGPPGQGGRPIGWGH